MSAETCVIHVNGERFELRLPPLTSLSQALREHLGLTGTKEGCRQGECGACTVLLDGRPVLSCITLALEAQGRQVETIESLAVGGTLHPLQRAFVERGAVQCGFCTPGMILSAKALLDGGTRVDEQAVRRALAGNHCRCTGYASIIDAVLDAAKESP